MKISEFFSSELLFFTPYNNDNTVRVPEALEPLEDLLLGEVGVGHAVLHVAGTEVVTRGQEPQLHRLHNNIFQREVTNSRYTSSSGA